MMEEKDLKSEENKEKELVSLAEKAIPEETEKKLEFLKREEVRTMQKDIRRLREAEAEKERERIAAIESKRKKGEVEPETKTKVPSLEAPSKKPFKKSARPKKLLIRIIFVVLAVLVLGFIVWLSLREPTIKEPAPPEEVIPPEEEIIPPEEPELIIPSPFIPVEKIITLEISGNEEIPVVINQLMEEELLENSFTQIIIKNKEENRLASLEDISQGFQIETVLEVMQKLDMDNFNFLIYPQKEGRREVFIVRIKEKENLSESLETWETKISQEGLFVSENKIETKAASFKSFVLEDMPIRYLTISEKDSGVCYLLFEDYLVLSTSFGSLQKTIGELKALE